MKQELAAFEIMHLAKELQSLIDAKVEKIYDLENGILILIHLRSKGKQMLRIENKFIYLSSRKGEIPEKPSNFCLVLRKHLEGGRLKGIEQHNFERIVKLIIESKHGVHKLIVELFGKGNVVLCDESYKIITSLRIEKWQRCEIRPKSSYIFPKQRFDFLNANEGALKEMFISTKQDSLVKSLAIDLGLGGVYAEEVCLISNIDKNKEPKKIADDEVKKILNAMLKLKEEKKSPMIVYEDGEMVDAVPIALNYYKNKKQAIFENYCSALDFLLSRKFSEMKKKIIESEINKEIERIKRIIEMQQKNLEGLEDEIKENQEKANAIYQNYELISEILRELKKARKKYSWEEIKKRLKGHKIIKEINEKTGEIVLEI